MKKVILIAAIAAVSTGANAQVNFGAQVGGNMANAKVEYTDAGTTTKQKTKSKFGFLIGAIAEIPFSSNVSFRPELNFVQKGYKVDVNETQTSGGITATSVGSGKITLNFIELPLNFVYSVPAGAGNVFFGAGPAFGFGLSGKYDQTSTTTVSGPGFPTSTESSTEKGDVKFDGKKYEDLAANDVDAHLKSFDFGGNILAGYKMSNGIAINLGYTMGFSNLDPNKDQSLKTKGFTIKLGYLFGAKSNKEK